MSSWVLLIVLCSGGPLDPAARAEPRFGFRMDRETFRELRALAPELPEARWPGLTPEGQQAWDAGQLATVYNSGSYLERDFNGDGQPDSALLLDVTGAGGATERHLLLATRRTERAPWSRVGVIPVPSAFHDLDVRQVIEQLGSSLDAESAAFLEGGADDAEDPREPATGPRRPFAEWVARLDAEDPRVRLEAVEALGRLGPDSAGAIDPLAQRLYDAEELVRDGAAHSLQRIGPQVVPALRVLVEREGATLGRHDPGGRAQRLAVHLLGQLRPVTPEAVALASSVCQARTIHEVVRHDACASLAQLGQLEADARDEAIATMLSVFREADAGAYLRTELIGHLGGLGPDPATIAAFARALRDSEVFIRRAVAAELGKFGAAAAPALPDLEAASADPDADVRASARGAIERIEG
jgi:HEAT repeat protein